MGIYRNNIKEIRTRLKLTQEDMSTGLGLTAKTMHNIETGKTVPSITIAYKIKNFLNCKTVEEIFPESEYKTFIVNPTKNDNFTKT